MTAKNKVPADLIGKTLVIASTLNQMVNYIPIRMLKPSKVYCLTDPDDLDHKKWNKHLRKELERGCSVDNFEVVKIKPGDIDLVAVIRKELPADEEIIFNMTGGQRYLLPPIFQLLSQRENKGDKLLYLEGNSNRLMFYHSVEKAILPWNLPPGEQETYADIPDLQVETALRLMGFETTIKTAWRYRCYKDEAKKVEVENGKDIPIDLADHSKIFVELCAKDTNFRSTCLDLNRPQENGAALVKLKADDRYEKFFKSAKPGDKSLFGNLFENMVAAEFLKILPELPVSEMLVSCRLNYSNDSPEWQDNCAIDEFDIIMVTNSGKLILFELKTGKLSTDNARSHKYSTYAVGGVYGLPILVVPLKGWLDGSENPVGGEICQFNQIATLVGHKKALDDKKDAVAEGRKNQYSTLCSALGTAKRAGLQIWGIDVLGTKLSEYFKK